MTIALIFDLILLVVLVVVANSYARKGLVAGVVQFVGSLASLAGAVLLSHQVSPMVFEQFFESGFTKTIESALASGSQLSLDQTVEKYTGFLPDALKQNIIASAQELFTTGAPELATQLVEQVIAPLVTPIIAVVVFFVAFALCKFLVGLLVAVLTNFNRIPLVGSFNKLLGFAMGLCAGVLDLYLILCGVWAIILITGGSLEWLNDATLSHSIAYQLFGQFNPFYRI